MIERKLTLWFNDDSYSIRGEEGINRILDLIDRSFSEQIVCCLERIKRKPKPSGPSFKFSQGGRLWAVSKNDRAELREVCKLALEGRPANFYMGIQNGSSKMG